MKKNIVGKRVFLSPLMESDFAKVCSIWRDADELPENPGMVFGVLNNNIQKGQAVFWTINCKTTLETFGSCEFNNIDVIEKTADIGCVLKKQYRGFGYMTEALNLIIKHGVNCDLIALGANIKESNIKSKELFCRLGFSKTENKELDFQKNHMIRMVRRIEHAERI